MIPYSLKMQGIRDYPAKIIPLGEADEHILITGPNGVGKSTLTFCMGAVLRSAKVDPEGLRSSNLPENQPWYAKLSLLFKNEGETRIDGPPFIAFEVIIQQETKNGALQREYRIATGTNEKELTNITSYTSGNTLGRNFSAYKDELQYTYKIDPDLYHLIWYQQEVNQFAAMSPEERFRQFSNMFHIADMQKEWESALESVKEAQRELEYLKGVVKSAKFEVNNAEKERNQYRDNRKRLVESGRKHFTYMNVLREKYSIALNDSQEKIMQLNKTQDELLAAEKVEIEKSERFKQQVSTDEQKSAALDEIIEQKKTQIFKIESEEKHVRVRAGELEKQLENVTEKGKRLKYHEDEAIEYLTATKETLKQLNDESEQLGKKKTELDEHRSKVIRDSAEVSSTYKQLKQQIDEAKELIRVHHSSHALEEKLSATNQKQTELFERRQLITNEKDQLNESIQQLKQNKVYSKRQEEGLRDLQRHGIEAFTLRDLIELSPSANLILENKISTIKYAIFYDAINYVPKNDLYYVSLKRLIPDRGIVQLSQLGLQIREGLNEQMQNHSSKALWWIEQFFKTSPMIKGDVLVDDRGIRGAQEHHQYILSDAIIQKRLAEQIIAYEQAEKQLKENDAAYENGQQTIQQLNGMIRRLNEAESILLRESERLDLQKRIDELEKLKSDLDDDLNDVENKQQETYQSISYEKQREIDLDEECRIHEELGALAEQQMELQALEWQLQQIRQEKSNMKNEQDDLISQLEEKNQQIRESNTAINDLEVEINRLASRLKMNKQTIETEQENLENYDVQISRLDHELVELQEILPQEAKEIDDDISVEWSIPQLTSENDQFKVQFDNARTEKVNEAAEANYTSIKADYDKKNSELAESEILLEKNTKLAGDLEDKLETTIQMHLTKIDLLFQKYMNEFQFEGVVEKERREDKQGRITYLLYVKARKIGHQGTLEDVSHKARNGKVGVGVSGGEESLSSLLFALALLQNLSISPSYIVLDEFDSALDDGRKDKVFQLYASELKRKLIILSPKAHDRSYYDYFSKVFIVEHDSSIPQSRITGLGNLKKA